MKCEIPLPSSSISLYQFDGVNLIILILSPFIYLICLWLGDLFQRFIRNLVFKRFLCSVIFFISALSYLYILGMFVFTNLSVAGGFELIERCRDSGLEIDGLKMSMTGLGPPLLLLMSIAALGVTLIALIELYLKDKSI